MKIDARRRRHKRITRKMTNRPDTVRLVVFRSNKHTYAQLVDDRAGKVITGCSTLNKGLNQDKVSANKDVSKKVGLSIAEKAKGFGIKKICFDRAGYRYHGRVKAVAEGAREGGLDF